MVSWREYFVFLLLGTISAPLGFILGKILTSANLLRLEGPSELLFALIVCSILLAIGLYFLRANYALKGFGVAIVLSLLVYSALLLDPRLIALVLVLMLLITVVPLRAETTYILRAFAISCVAFLLAFGAILAWGAYEHYNAKYIEVKKLGYPDKFVNLTEKEIESYPVLKEAIEEAREQSWVEVRISPDKYFELKNVFSGFEYIRVGEEYYRIHMIKLVGIRKLSYTPLNYVEVTEEELSQYPSLKKVIDTMGSVSGHNIEGTYFVNTSREEFYRIKEFIESLGTDVIAHKGKYFEVSTDCKVHLKKIQYPPSSYASVSEAELAECEVIKRAVDSAKKSGDGKAILKVSPEEWEEAIDFLQKKGSYIIEFNGEYYGFGFMTA